MGARVLEFLGSLTLIWVLASVAFTVLCLSLNAALVKALDRLVPRQASTVYLLWCGAPMIMSLLICTLLFIPGLDSIFVAPHCHHDCEVAVSSAHLPITHSLMIALLGVTACGYIILVIARQLIRHIQTVANIKTKLDYAGIREDDYFVLVDSPPTVFTLGFIRQRMYIAQSLLDLCSAQHLCVINAHEQAHIVRSDNLRLLAARVFCIFLPRFLNKRLLYQLHIYTEEACDDVAAKQYGSVVVAETLLEIHKLVNQSRSCAALNTAFAEHAIEARVTALFAASDKLELPKYSFVALAVAGLMGLMILLAPLHHIAEWLIH